MVISSIRVCLVLNLFFYLYKEVEMALNPRSGRLAYEIKLFQTRPPWGVVCTFEKDDQCDMFLVTMRGPKATPYENGSFKLTITIPEKYPFEPPLVKFVTPVYHPNIDKGQLFTHLPLHYLIPTFDALKYTSAEHFDCVMPY